MSVKKTDDNGNAINVNLTATKNRDNCFIEDGDLVLRTITDKDGKTTIASSVSTAGKMRFRYGYLEMRAKVPFVKGAWPSFWMRSDCDAGDTSPFGEIDIFEIYGTKYVADNGNCVGISNIHKWRMPNACNSSQGVRTYLNGANNPEFEFNPNEYHIFGMDWAPDYLAFYIDGQLYCKIDTSENADFCRHDTNNDGVYDHKGMSCYDEYYFICLNNWVFGDVQQSWMSEDQRLEHIDGGVNADYRIDYIRLYQNELESFLAK